jgi:hypothetical protein
MGMFLDTANLIFKPRKSPVSSFKGKVKRVIESFKKRDKISTSRHIGAVSSVGRAVDS